ncbi:MAG: hypothetical protein M1833_002466 [Piccolia ochrophora]|nr:MAG: hypothetical protein M1833_002466 [Piccolia ochrophora]
MVSDAVYELCLPILRDVALEEEDKTDQLEELLGKETELNGSSLENAVLDVLWRFRDAKSPSAASPAVRHTVLRRPSPAAWQIPQNVTPAGGSPASSFTAAAPPGFGSGRPSFARTRSNYTGSPFTSPRPSPRLAFSSPRIPHSPSLNAYEFPRETAPAPDVYGDYGSDAVDWLVNEDALADASSAAGATGYESGLNGAAAAFIQPQQSEMGPYDILRSVLGEAKSDEEIEKALEANAFDLTATIATLMGERNSATEGSVNAGPEGDTTKVLIGKSMNVSPSPQRPVTPAGQQRSPIVCKFWLSTGTCLRADCRFSHDLSNHICKYWVMGNCLAGETCVFSHDPSHHLINRLASVDINRIASVDDNGIFSGSPPQTIPQHMPQGQDPSAFPSLQQSGQDQWAYPSQTHLNVHSFAGLYGGNGLSATSPGLKSHHSFLGDTSSYRSHSRPSSRGHSRAATPSIPSVDDTDAFPSLGASGGKGGKKHHGKRGGHGHGHKDHREVGPNSLADVVRMSPAPRPGGLRSTIQKSRSYTGTRENSLAAQSIAAPQHLPWLDTGERANKAYLKARQDAIKHGGLRNKFLQSAAQAWNRNDARAAKALSLRGQSENDLMRKAHREAARQLYEERNQGSSSGEELYVDLHGLHPEEAMEYLERVLLEQQSASKPVYAITGTGHHSKNGKDKVGKAIRGFLNDWRYAYKEFSVPGDRNNVGGILGIDARSFDRAAGSGEPRDTGPGEGQRETRSASPVPANVRLLEETPTSPAAPTLGESSLDHGAGWLD